MSLFKRKLYLITVTFTDNSETKHSNTWNIKQQGNVISFNKGEGLIKVNWDKVYGISVREMP